MKIKFIINLLYSSITFLLTRCFALIATIIIANIFDNEALGTFTVIQANLVVFQLFSSFSITTIYQKFFSSNNSNVKQSYFYSSSLQFVFILSFIFSLGFYLYLSEFILQNIEFNTGLIASIAASVVIYALANLYRGLYQGLEMHKLLTKMTAISFVVFFPIFLYLIFYQGIEGALVALVILPIIELTAYYFGLNRFKLLPMFKLDKQGWKYFFKELKEFGLPSFLSSFLLLPMAFFINHRILTFSNIESAAIINVSMQWRNLLLFIPVIASTVMLPMLNKVYKEDKNMLNSPLKFSSIFIFSVIGIVSGMMYIFSAKIISLYGFNYYEVEVFKLMIFGAALASINLVVGQYLAIINKMWVGLSVNFLWAILFYTTAFFANDVIEVAEAFLYSYIFLTILQFILVCRYYEKK